MSDRIRWDDKTPGNGDVYNIAHIGYVGTVEESAFIIYTPDELHDNWLLSVRLVPGSQFLYANSQRELKAEAERWLEEFVSSLGAIFPPPPCHRCEEPITGTPVTAEDDSLNRQWCSEECLTAEAEAYHEQHYTAR